MLSTALMHYKISISTELTLRKSFLYQSSKLDLAAISMQRHERAFKTAVELYLRLGNKENFEDMLMISESNKYGAVSDAFAVQQSGKHSNEEVTKLENALQSCEQLHLQIDAELRQFNSSVNNTEILFLQRESKRTVLKEDSIKNILLQQHPDYYKAKYEYEAVSADSLQHHLSPNTLMLSFSSFSDSIYILCISKNDLSLMTVANDSDFNQRLENVISSINNFEPQTRGADFSHYTSSAVSVYHRLFKNVLESKKEVSKLVLIPDGRLSYLSFETLLTEKPDSSSNNYGIRNLKYLLNDYTVVYAYSASLWKQTTTLTFETKDKDFIGFAPSANQHLTASEDCFGPLFDLQFNVAEVEDVGKILHGNSFTGIHATTNIFIREAGNYSILHLATHACEDSIDPSRSRIYFHDRSLTIEALYLLNLDANLVTLSACNTGSGKLQQGEGVMSISRAFIYSGCSSIVMSLWNVDDASTSQVMQFFYTELKKGSPRDEALRLAKIKFLNQADKLHSHPCYWAPFIFIGNAKPLTFKSHDTRYYLLGFSIAFTLVTLIFICARRLK
jgi:CHAT domain-containing protein